MHKLQLTIHNTAGKVQYDKLHAAPSTWKEMTRHHLMHLAAALLAKQPIGDAALILSALLFNIPQRLFICITSLDREALADSVTFLFQKNGLNDWLIPSIWFGFFKYYGPKHRLANLTVQEYDKCEYCYEQWGRTQNNEYLDTLAAILYRPQRFWGINEDIRVPLTTHGYTKRARRFKKLSPALRVAIYLNYEGCRNFLHSRFKGVFEKPGSGKAAKPQITPWPKIIESGSNDIFGPHETTKQTLLYDFLSRLESRIKEMKELEGK